MQAPAAPPPSPITPAAPHIVIATGEVNAVAQYKAADAARSELRSQLDRLEERRRSLSEQIRENAPSGADRAGMEAQIVDVDKRILDLQKEISAADQAVAKAAGVPGAIVEQRPNNVRTDPPPEAWVLGGMFIVVVMLPLSLAFARRIWRRGKDVVVSFPQDLSDRLNRLDQAVDSIAVEVERIGEGQRFVTRVLAENGSGRALGVGAAAPVDVGARDKARAERGAI